MARNICRYIISLTPIFRFVSGQSCYACIVSFRECYRFLFSMSRGYKVSVVLFSLFRSFCFTDLGNTALQRIWFYFVFVGAVSYFVLLHFRAGVYVTLRVNYFLLHVCCFSSV